MDDYTVLLPTFNEEKRIEFVLRNFQGHAPVIILDDGSTDGTLELAKRYGCKVVRRPFSTPAYINRFYAQWALDQAPTEYVFLCYASMLVPSGLLKVFSDVACNRTYKAVRHDFQAITYTRYIQKPVIRRRAGACHFFAKDAIDLERSCIHNEWPLCVPDSQVLVLRATDDLSVHGFRDYDTRLTELKQSGYSDADAIERFKKGERTSAVKMICKTMWRFFHGYIRCGGFRAGVPGLLYHMWWAQMVFNIQARIWEYQEGMTLDEVRLLNARMKEDFMRKWGLANEPQEEMSDLPPNKGNC